MASDTVSATDKPNAEIRLPVRFRRRLTVAFIVVAGVSSALLGGGSYFYIQQQRWHGFGNRAESQTDLAAAIVSVDPSANGLNRLIDFTRTRVDLEAIATLDGATYSSDPRLTLDLIPKKVQDAPPNIKRIQQTTHFQGTRYLVTSRYLANSKSRSYLLFSEADVRSSLAQLRNSLIVAWFAVSISSALVGSLIARRTLSPIQNAAGIARSLTEGLLDTTIPLGDADEFGAWSQYFNNMAVALRDKLNALSAARDRERRFTADVAHELRTPLSGMVTAASLLKGSLDDLPKESRRPAELLINDVSRLRSLVLELLEMSQLDAATEGVNIDTVDLRDLVGSIARNTERQDINIDVNNITVPSDRHRLERVLTNLITNAIKHGEAPIDVRAFRTDGAVLIEVEDSGPGIPEEHLPFIFDRFYKASSSRNGGGSGLGLAIALRNAQDLGGTIMAINSEAGGAQFSLVVPIHPESDSE